IRVGVAGTGDAACRLRRGGNPQVGRGRACGRTGRRFEAFPRKRGRVWVGVHQVAWKAGWHRAPPSRPSPASGGRRTAASVVAMVRERGARQVPTLCKETGCAVTDPAAKPGSTPSGMAALSTDLRTDRLPAGPSVGNIE